MNRLLRYTIILHILLLILSGCSGISKVVKHRSLVAETTVSDTIFLDSITDNQRNIWVQIRNTTGEPLLDIKKNVIQLLVEKGYKICKNQSEADIILQVNVLEVLNNLIEDDARSVIKSREMKKNSISHVVGKHMHAGSVGAAAGKIIAGNMTGAIFGGLASTFADTLVNNMTKVVKFSVIVDVQVSQKSIVEVNQSISVKSKYGSNSERNVWWNDKHNWKIYNTRIKSDVQKINLRFDQAAHAIKKSLSLSISGIF